MKLSGKSFLIRQHICGLPQIKKAHPTRADELLNIFSIPKRVSELICPGAAGMDLAPFQMNQLPGVAHKLIGCQGFTGP